jgi:hypothetical protein
MFSAMPEGVYARIAADLEETLRFRDAVQA